MKYNTINISRLKADCTDESRVIWSPLPSPVRTSWADTSHVLKSIAIHRPDSQATRWEFEVKLEGWEKKDNMWEPENIMTTAKRRENQYWLEIGGQPKMKGKAAGMKQWSKFLLDSREMSWRDVCFWSGQFGSLRGFWKIIWDGCDVGRRLWSCYGVALQEAHIAVSSSETWAWSSITFTSICIERLFTNTRRVFQSAE